MMQAFSAWQLALGTFDRVFDCRVYLVLYCPVFCKSTGHTGSLPVFTSSIPQILLADVYSATTIDNDNNNHPGELF
jgi:hypothetical protein